MRSIILIPLITVIIPILVILLDPAFTVPAIFTLALVLSVELCVLQMHRLLIKGKQSEPPLRILPHDGMYDFYDDDFNHKLPYKDNNRINEINKNNKQLKQGALFAALVFIIVLLIALFS